MSSKAITTTTIDPADSALPSPACASRVCRSESSLQIYARAILARCEYPSRLLANALSSGEFIRRFCTHILPRGFRRLRQYGWQVRGVDHYLPAGSATPSTGSAPVSSVWLWLRSMATTGPAVGRIPLDRHRMKAKKRTLRPSGCFRYPDRLFVFTVEKDRQNGPREQRFRHSQFKSCSHPRQRIKRVNASQQATPPDKPL